MRVSINHKVYTKLRQDLLPFGDLESVTNELFNKVIKHWYAFGIRDHVYINFTNFYLDQISYSFKVSINPFNKNVLMINLFH